MTVHVPALPNHLPVTPVGPDVPSNVIARWVGHPNAAAEVTKLAGSTYDKLHSTTEIDERIAARRPLLEAGIRLRDSLSEQYHDAASAKAVPTATACYMLSPTYQVAVLLYLLLLAADIGSAVYVPLVYIKASGLIGSYSSNPLAAVPLTTIFLAIVPALRTVSGTLKNAHSRTLYRRALVIFGVVIVVFALIPAFSWLFNVSSIAEAGVGDGNDMGPDGPSVSSIHPVVGFALTAAHLTGSIAFAAGTWLGIDAITDVNKVHDHDRAADSLLPRLQEVTARIDVFVGEIGADQKLKSTTQAGRTEFISECMAFLAWCETRWQAEQLARRDQFVTNLVSDLDRTARPLPSPKIFDEAGGRATPPLTEPVN